MTEASKKNVEASVTFRTHPRIKEQIESIAESQMRSISWVVNKLMMQVLRDDEKVIVERLTEKL
jgi:hypothetical protein